MKVYVVMRGEYSDREVIAVRTEEKRAQLLAKYYQGWVDEFDTEDTLTKYEDGNLLWCVEFNNEFISVYTEDPRWFNEDDSYRGNIYVRAKSKEEAIVEATKKQLKLGE